MNYCKICCLIIAALMLGNKPVAEAKNVDLPDADFFVGGKDISTMDLLYHHDFAGNGYNPNADTMLQAIFEQPVSEFLLLCPSDSFALMVSLFISKPM